METVVKYFQTHFQAAFRKNSPPEFRRQVRLLIVFMIIDFGMLIRPGLALHTSNDCGGKYLSPNCSGRHGLRIRCTLFFVLGHWRY